MTPIVPEGVDMNDPCNLQAYTQMLIFKTDTSRNDITFEDPSFTEQRSLQALAHQLGLDYEYSKSSRAARISRPDVILALDSANCDSRNNGGLQTSMGSATTGHSHSGAYESYPQQHPLSPGYFYHESRPIGSATTSAIDLIPSSIFDSAFSLDLYSPNENMVTPSPSSPVLSLEQLDKLPSIMEVLPRNPNVEKSVKRKHSGSSVRNHTSKRPWTFLTSRRRSPERRSITCSNKIYFCDVCQVECSGTDDLNYHVQSHATQKSFQCSDCARTFHREDVLLRHQQIIHPTSTDVPVATATSKSQKRLSNNSQQRYNISSSRTGFSSSQGLPLSPDENTLAAALLATPPTPQQNRTKSKPSSTYSIQSERRQSRQSSIFSRRSSICSQTGSSYQEIVFDSDSIYASSQLSGKGRRGPLSDLARNSAKAVKRVGACWRCKFLRKTCDPRDPCALCPRGEKSKWETVGCRRGNFQAELPLNALCRRDTFSHTAEEEKRAISALASASQEAATRRDTWVRQEPSEDEEARAAQPATLNSGAVEARELLVETFSKSLADQPSAGALGPVKECVLAIIWELFNCPSSWPVLEHLGLFDGLVRLLGPAAVYQTRQENNQLIAQSLICLRTCLEALRKKNSGFIDRYSHNYCVLDPNDCKVEFVATVNKHLQSYFKELSRVMFKKENIRKKDLCYLSIFYSFCIQSLVRKALIMLSTDNDPHNSAMQQSKQYLYLPLRLFIASHGSVDPLASDILSSPDINDDFEQARQAVRQWTWCLKGVGDSATYLKGLFEDDGRPITPSRKRGEASDAFTMDYLSDNDDPMDLLGSVDYLTAFWDLDSAKWDDNMLRSP